jgi:hypothetical protein
MPNPQLRASPALLLQASLPQPDSRHLVLRPPPLLQNSRQKPRFYLPKFKEEKSHD